MSSETALPALSLDTFILNFDRPDEVRRAVDSCRRKQIRKVIVLDNGSLDPLGDVVGAECIRSEVNLGVCGGRNLLLAGATADLALFLDDDAYISDEADLEQVIGRFAADPALAVVAGLVRHEGGAIVDKEFPMRRVRKIREERQVGYFIGTACVIRRSSFEQVGGYDESFFYGHEETDLSLRLATLGQAILYCPSLAIEHRPSETGRIRTSNIEARLLANRIRLARRDLPMLARLIHLCVWHAYYGLPLLRSAPRSLRALFKEAHQLAAVSPSPATTRRIRHREVWRLHRLGYRVFW